SYAPHPRPPLPAFPTRRSSDLAASRQARKRGRDNFRGQVVVRPRERRLLVQLLGCLKRTAREEQLQRVGCPHERLGELLSAASRSEEHTSELQSRGHLVCRLLL